MLEGDSFIMNGHSIDRCLQLVADRNRRRIIQRLRHETSSETAVDDLVDRLHSEGSVSDDGRMSREQLTIQLYHVSLPKLEAHGVIEHDRGRGIVRYQPNDLVETVLDSIPGAVSVSNP